MIDEKKLIKDIFYVDGKRIPDRDCAGEPVMIAFEELYKIINNQSKVDEWIPVEERLPEEHDSIFAKLKGTDQWHKGMFEKVSDDVNVTIEYSNGERKTITMHTKDGQWSVRNTFISFKVISWKPLPEPMRKEV